MRHNNNGSQLGALFDASMAQSYGRRLHTKDERAQASILPSGDVPHICLFGEENLSVLAPEYGKQNVGGEQVQQTLLARALLRRGYRVSMITHDYGQQDGATWSGIQVFKTSAPNAGLPCIRFIHPRATSMWNACHRARADIYYTSCAGFHVGLLAEYARRNGARFIFRTAHDTDSEPDRLLIRFWRDKKIYEYGLRHTHGILTQTERQRETLLENYGLVSRTAIMLVDESGTRVAYDERISDALWVNNFREFKRPAAYLDLCDRVPELSCHMVGGKLVECAALYDSMAARARGIRNLQFHGQIPYQTVNEYYARTKIFVSTSHTEGFPNSYLQAWARGTPVVAFFDPDGTIARHGLGEVVNTLEEMASAVRSLATDRRRWETYSERCRAYMAHEYAEERVLKPYLDLVAEQVEALAAPNVT
jgi:glycosyltransferase involved in cell wall biosynthesis